MVALVGVGSAALDTRSLVMSSLSLLPCLSSHLSDPPSVAHPLSGFDLESVLRSASATSIHITVGESLSSESSGWGPGLGSAFSQLCGLVQLAHLPALGNLLYQAIVAKGHQLGDLSNAHFLSGCSGGCMPVAPIVALAM